MPETPPAIKVSKEWVVIGLLNAVLDTADNSIMSQEDMSDITSMRDRLIEASCRPEPNSTELLFPKE